MTPKIICNLTSVLILSLIMFSCKQQKENFRSQIDLSGTWQFSLDSTDRGMSEGWFSEELEDEISLPGTTDTNKKGYENTDTTTMHLNRLYVYEGPAWYQKKVSIPEDWSDQHITLFMERTKSSYVWVDDQYIGDSFILQSPQEYDLSSVLDPGEHMITIRVNNELDLTPYGNVHIYTDETQTNWNGIIGNIYLEATDKTFIRDLQVYPDIEQKKIKIKLSVENGLNLEEINIRLNVSKNLDDKINELKSIEFTQPCDSVIELEYDLGDDMDLWDEYQQPLYILNAIISHDSGVNDHMSAPFGMRKFSTNGTQFTINGRITFLRGKHDACVFPKTGHSPMNVEEWLDMFKIVKSYGLNHVRFHSWCPPEVAFDAADQLGLYLQAETPFWRGLDSDTIQQRLKNEGVGLLKSYANHPSFVMFSPGNEIWSGHERVKEYMTALKEIDDRPLYTHGSNNNIGYVNPPDYAEFHVAARTSSDGDTVKTHTRLTHAFADSREGGILNTQEPNTLVNFDYPVSQIDVPLISHEIGQYQIYPDYNEINKYKGVVRAWNLEVFKDSLEKAGMLDQDSIFQQASGAWSALCYKAEMEAAFRTKGFAGFQLLDLQDFPGQGTALVGILDAFMDNKGVINKEEWLQSCNDVVTLLSFEKYCWTNEETFTATVEVANYSNKDLSDNLIWEVLDEEGKTIKEGAFESPNIQMGRLNAIGQIKLSLDQVQTPQKLLVNISIENTKYNNSYPIWVYPEASNLEEAEIKVATQLDQNLIDKLKEGSKVLLFPEESSVAENSVGGLFPPDFWNYGMFKSISESNNKPVSPGTLGLLMDPKHPLFNSFPTDFHTNWQWWSIVRTSNPLILDKTDHEYRPVVQFIDNLERNHKLGLIFEFKVGEGKLLVCMSRLNEIRDRPEATQLYQSILNYMKSDDFDPEYEAGESLLKEIL